MSIGLSHRNGRAVVVGAGPHGRVLLILNTLFCESSRTSRMMSWVNSPKMKAPS